MKDYLDACGTYAILVCEYRIVFVDYITGQVSMEIFFSDLKGVQVTSLEVFSHYKWLAFGGNDGSVRLWDIERREFVRPPLTGGHKSNASVNRLFSFYRDGITWLVSTGTDGAVCLWNINTGKLEKAVPKAHDGGVIDLTYHTLTGLLVTTGADRNIIVWDLRVLQEMRKTSTGKKPYVFAQALMHPQFPANALVYFYRDSQELQVTDFDHTDSRFLVSLTDIRAPSRKESKNHKIHSIVVHPLLPHLLLVNSSKGSFLLKISFARPPDCAPIKRSVAQGRAEILVHYEVGSKAISKYITHKSCEPEIVADLKGPNTIMTFNRSGTFLIVQYPDMQMYQLFNTSSLMGWKVVEEGHFRGLIGIATKQERFAFVEAVYPQVEKQQSKGLFKKKDDKSNQATPTTRFVIKEISDTPKIIFELATPQRAIQQVHGGQLIGINWVPIDQKDLNCFQFYKWDSISESSKVGQSLPSPKSVVWDNSRSMVALLFKASFGIYSVKLEEREPVSLLFTHRLSVYSILWDTAMLFMVTDDAIKCYFTNAKDDPITIASYNADTNATEDETPFITSTRPKGAISLIVNSEDKLYVLDCSRQVHAIPLGGALLHCLSSATTKNLQQSLKFAEQVHPRFHHFLALYFSRHGLKRELLQLPGLDDWWKLRHCVANKFLDEALPLLKRLVKSIQMKFDTSSPIPPSNSTNSNLVSTISTPIQSISFSLDKLIDSASELAMLARAQTGGGGGGGQTNQLAANFIRAIIPLDPIRGYMLLAIHFAAISQQSEIAKIIKEIHSLPKIQQNNEFMVPVLMFCMACVNDPSISNTWKSFITSH